MLRVVPFTRMFAIRREFSPFRTDSDTTYVAPAEVNVIWLVPSATMQIGFGEPRSAVVDNRPFGRKKAARSELYRNHSILCLIVVRYFPPSVLCAIENNKR